MDRQEGDGGFLALGPSILEIHSAHEHPRSLLRSCGLEPSTWQRVRSRKGFDDLLIAAGLEPEAVLAGAVATPEADTSHQLVPGSSTLAMLLAMPAPTREGSTFGTWLDESPLASTLWAALNALPCRISSWTTGVGPSACLILTSQSESDRFMVTFTPDDAPDVPTDFETQGHRIVVDSYELSSSAFAESIVRRCQSTGASVYISLGGAESLGGIVTPAIETLLDHGAVAAVAGTGDQFAAVRARMRSTVSLDHVPTLLTFGAAGMLGKDSEGVVWLDAPNIPVGRISPSGAGDTAAGVFFAGIAQAADLRRCLELAREMVRLVLLRQESWVINEVATF